MLSKHFSCEPLERQQQWGEVGELLADMPPMPLVTLADHNNIMVLGKDSETISKEIPTIVHVCNREGGVLAELFLEGSWVRIHGEHRAHSVKGKTHMVKMRCIDRIHVSLDVLHWVCSTYVVTTPLGHKTMALCMVLYEGLVRPLHFRSPSKLSGDS